MTDYSRSSADHDLAALQARVLRRRQRYAQAANRVSHLSENITEQVRRHLVQPRALPARYVLHLFVVVLVPLAILASRAPLESLPAMISPPSPPTLNSADFIVPLAPLSLGPTTEGDTPVPDSDFAAIDALPLPAFRPDWLTVQPLAATVVAESANVRSGPGTNYDKIGDLVAGTPLRVLAQFQGWYQAQRPDGGTIWIAAELLDLDPTAVDLLPQAINIPAPPPAKIGLVAEEGLNLRDGPGTAYVGMTKLKAGTQLDLLAHYGDWFQVQTPDDQAGWVLGQYLTMAPGVLDRVTVVTSVPEANPALVGHISERNVNLRGGPDAAYDKLGTLDMGVKLDLLGRYKDWFKIRTPRGTVGWVSSELLDVSAFVERRIPTVRDIPALVQARPAAPSQAARRSLPAPSAAASSVTEFAVQFIGARYTWGGSSPSGFDCSGFTRYIYKTFGLDLPHSSAGQFSSNYGTIISNPADLRPGDIVFFVNTYKRGISHVGIYIGNGDVVQAMSPKLGVGVADVNDGYWAAHYYGAIRPLR